MLFLLLTLLLFSVSSNKVTCCLVISQLLEVAWVDDKVVPHIKTYTSEVYSTYYIVFDEPVRQAVMAIVGFTYSEDAFAGLGMTCITNGSNPFWNFTSIPDLSWTQTSSLRIPDYTANRFRPDFQFLNYSSYEKIAIGYDGDLGSSCVAPGTINIGHRQGMTIPRSIFWVLRKKVYYGIPVPTASFDPTPSPTTMEPTFAPITHPPSSSPTTSVPSTPSSNEPTSSPTTVAPSYSPTFPVPTPSPRYQVTCCFTALLFISEFWVDEVNIAPTVTPPLIPLRESMSYCESFYAQTRHVVFPEPSGDAVIGIVGASGNEVFRPSLSMRCNSSNPYSNWNMESYRGTGIYSWKNVDPLSYSMSIFPEGWNTLGFTGYNAPLGRSIDSSYGINNDCGTYSGEKVRPSYGFHRYWALRRIVLNSSSNTP